MNHQNRAERPWPVRCRALNAAALLCFTVGALYIASDTSRPSSSLHYDSLAIDQAISLESRRELSVALPHGGCLVTYAKLTETPITQTWQASFPGSGSRMTWSLVEALTGIRTNDDYDSHERGYENVVAVKTHYPVKNAKRRYWELDKLFGRAMVILRNPINAIPSYFNLQYEHLNHLPNHSTRGPNEDWLQYRDHPGYGVSAQLVNYEKFVEYWMEKYADRRNLFLASYEDLTDDYLGPVVATGIARFLGESEGVDPIAPESIPCVWMTIVNYKNAPPPPDKKVIDASARMLGGSAKGAELIQASTLRKMAAKGEFAQEMSTGRKGVQNRKAQVLGGKTNSNPRTLNVGKGASPQEKAIVSRRAQMLGGKTNTNASSLKVSNAASSQEKLNVREGARKLSGSKTHADPSSLRTGPKVRPYTQKNLTDMLAMFERLVRKYSHDQDFVRIITSYIEHVSKIQPSQE